jgi:hypothetical protein
MICSNMTRQVGPMKPICASASQELRKPVLETNFPSGNLEILPELYTVAIAILAITY